MGTVHFQTLEYAAVLVGGEDELAHRLGVSRLELDQWRSGRRPPLAVFLKAVDIVHDAALAQLRSYESKPGDRSDCNGDRVLPGEGILPLKAMFNRIEAAGYKGFFSIEMFNADLWALPCGEAAKRMYASMGKAVLRGGFGDAAAW